MGILASPAQSGLDRDASAFGGLVPSGAFARSDETLVAVLGIEHFLDAAVAHILVLTDAPGMIDWDPAGDLAVHDDQGGAYQPTVLAKTQGLGQLAVTVGLTPQVATEAATLEFEVRGLARVSPPRGDEPTVARELSGGPWQISVPLTPPRTVTEIPPPAERRQRLPEPGTVPVRTLGGFRGIVPVGQARHAEGVVVCATAVETYRDRWVLTLAAFGPHDQGQAAPAIGRARVSAWDDLGNRYRATPLQGAARDEWSEVAVEMVPPLDPAATTLAIRVADIPRGSDPGLLPVPGPFVFGVRIAP